MLTLRTEIRVAGITGHRIIEFLSNCRDADYRRWWPGTHLSFHTVKRLSGDIGNIVFMDEYVGTRRITGRAIVTQVVPSRRIAWQMVKFVRLPVWLTIDLEVQNDDVRLVHTIEAGFRGAGRILDPVFRLYFTRRFVQAMDEHVRAEFPKLRDMLNA